MSTRYGLLTLLVLVLLLFSPANAEPYDAWNVADYFDYGQSLDASAQDDAMTGMFFGDGGTKLYLSGLSGDSIYQYGCNEAYNVSTCSFEKSISAQGNPRDLFWNSSGTTLYELDDADDPGATGYFYEYDCTEAWNLSSCSYTGTNKDTKGLLSTDMFFGDGGTKLYELDDDEDKIYQYDCSNPWDLSSCSYDSSISTQDGVPQGMDFKPDGSMLYESGSDSNKIYQYRCPTPWDLSSCSYEASTSSVNWVEDVDFSPKGIKMYELDASTSDSNTYVNQYSLPKCTELASDDTGDSVITVDGAGECSRIQYAVNNASDSHSQTNHLGGSYDSDTTTRFGEKINITKGIIINKVGFYCERDGSDLGTAYVRVRYCSNDTIMHSTSFDADSISTGQTWNEIKLDSSVTVSGDTCVRVMMEHSGGFDYIRWRNGDYSATDSWGTGTYYAGSYSSMDPATYYINYTHEIKVEPGTYTDNVDIGDRYINIEGNGTPSEIVVEASDGGEDCFRITGNDVILRNMTVKSGSAGIYGDYVNGLVVDNIRGTDNTYGIMSYGTNHKVTDSIFSNTYNSVIGSNDAYVENTTFKDTDNTAGQDGVILSGTNVTLEKCSVYNIQTGNAVFIKDDKVYIKNSTIRDNTANGIYFYSLGSHQVENTQIYNSSWALKFREQAPNIKLDNVTLGSGSNSITIDSVQDHYGTFNIKEVTTPPPNPLYHTNINRYINISGIDTGEYFDVLFGYEDTDIPANTTESSLHIWRHDGNWLETGFYQDQYLDTSTNIIGANITDSSTFGMMGDLPMEPPVPVDIQNTTGNFYIDYSWSAGSGNVTDSYNVSVDATNDTLDGWHNGTTSSFNCTGLGGHGWCDITVYAYNDTSTGSLNTTPLTDNFTVPNNPPDITNTSDASVIEGNNVSINFDYDDADGDTGTFDTNATQGSLDTGTGEYNWNTTVGDNGTYYWEFNVSDGYGGVDSYTALIDIVKAADVGKPINLKAETGNFWINWSWDPGANTETFNITKDDGTWLNDTTQEYYNASDLSPHAHWNISVRGWNASATGNKLSNQSSGKQQIPNNPISITNVSDPIVYENNPVSINFDYDDLDGDTPTFDTNAAQGSLDTATGEYTWSTAEDDDGTYEWTFNVSDGWGSIDEYNSTITVKKDGFVTDLPSSKWALLYGSSSTDVTKTVVDATDWIVLGNDQYQNYAAAAEVNLTTNVSFADVNLNTSRSDLKSVVTGLDGVSEVKNVRLEIPRVEDTGTVVVCPDATTLDEVSEGCTNGVKINSGETVDGMTVTEVTLGTQDYYEVSNVTGTGGIEFTPEEEEDEEPAPPEDGGGGAEPIETTVPPPPAPSPGEQPAPLPVIIGVIAVAAIILGLYFFARG